MKARSHRFPDPENYIDTTYYNEEEEYLDIGYQLLKIFDVNRYTQLSYIKKLFIDHNYISILPDKNYLPLLEELTCSSNKLTKIPTYPKLIFLNFAENNVSDISNYNNSNITYLDASFNKNIVINFILPKCKQLYITDCTIKFIDFNNFPNLEIFDGSNNMITKINFGSNLIEMNIQNNKISELVTYPKLKRLMADYNEISILNTLPELLSVTISYNQLTKIEYQPMLGKLIANNNKLSIIGDMPKLELVDISYNKINTFIVPLNVEYLSAQFNPITKLVLSENTLKCIKELQVNFETYRYIYDKYYKNFDSVNVQMNVDKLKQYLSKLQNIFNNDIIKYIIYHFTKIKFQNRKSMLFKISLLIYWKYFPKKSYKTLQELYETHEFKNISKNITNLYYKSIVITLYFNGYF